ncbi:MAG: DUF748 domain-containing protein [Opitutaceae bacterium]
MTKTLHSPPSTRARLGRIALWISGVLLTLLLVIRFVGSPIVTSLANKKLAALGDYHGRVGAIQLALWRATITANDFELFHTGHEADGPVIKVAHASLSLAPLALLRGTIGGRGSIRNVELSLVQDRPTIGKEEKSKEDAAKTKMAGEQPAVRAWQAKLQEGFPIEVTRFEVTNLRVKFVDRARAGAPQMMLEDFHLLATDFRTKPANADDLPAKLTVSGRFSGGGTLQVNATADAGAAQPHFNATMEVKDLALVPLRDFLKSYANVDVTRGTFEVFVAVKATGGRYHGYVKPFFHDLEFKATPDPEKNAAQQLATTVASAVTNLLKNDQGTVATKAPFQGEFANAKVDVWTTIENLLRNAFITSLREGFEGQKPS